MKNIELTKRALALLSASTFAVTMGGCGNSSTNQNSSSPTSSIISEIDSSKDQDISSIISSIVSTSSEENQSKDTTTEIGNTSKEEDTSSRVEDTSSRPQTSSKEENTSSKGQTSSKSEITSSKNQNSSNTVSSSSSQINTSSNTSSIVMPTRVTKENINDVDTFVYLANEFRKSSAPGALIGGIAYYHNDEKVHTNGYQEFEFFMAILNYEYMETETLKSLFGDCTKSEIEQYASFMEFVMHMPITYEIYYDFEAYCINKDLAHVLCDSAKGINEAYHQQNIDKLYDILYNYFLNEDSTLSWNSVNDGIDYYLYRHYKYMYKHFKDEEFTDMLNFLYSDVTWSYGNFVEEFYNRLHIKTKIYEK